jgi:hypothetical protein
MQFRSAIRSRNTQPQYAATVYNRNVRLQCVSATCGCNVCICNVCICNVRLQIVGLQRVGACLWSQQCAGYMCGDASLNSPISWARVSKRE